MFEGTEGMSDRIESSYVEYRDNGYWIRGEAISLDSIVHCFKEGLSPETIVHDCYPALRLEQVYGAITFYLANQSHIDAYLRESDAEWQTFRAEIEAKYPQSRRIYEKLRNASSSRSS